MLKTTRLKSLQRKAKKGFRGYPMATIAFYGPTNQIATKVVVSIVAYKEADPDPIQKWFSESDIRKDKDIMEQIHDMIMNHRVLSVAMLNKIIGCPHEEGIDYEEGGSCPACTYWQGIDRWTGKRV